MNQNDLNRAVARATGETVSTINAYGFVPLDDLERDEGGPHCVDWDVEESGRAINLTPHRKRAPQAA